MLLFFIYYLSIKNLDTFDTKDTYLNNLVDDSIGVFISVTQSVCMKNRKQPYHRAGRNR